jgi:hypothetical protein
MQVPSPPQNEPQLAFTNPLDGRIDLGAVQGES